MDTPSPQPPNPAGEPEDRPIGAPPGFGVPSQEWPPPPPGGWYPGGAPAQPWGGQPPWGAPPPPPPWGQSPWGEPPIARPPSRGRALAALIGIALIVISAGVALVGLVNRDQQPNVLGGAFQGDSSVDVAGLTARVTPAVVDITASFPDGLVAGTGMVITSGGEVLTNNHVVESARAIEAQIGGTGTVYRARVVGTDPNDDIALLQLEGASGLATVTIGKSSAVSVGDAVVAVGNALGRSGPPTGSGGQVTALDRTITATDESGQTSETLSGLIQVDATVLPGDSGGPLVDKDGRVVGMDTAASSRRFRFSTGGSEGFAIPIAGAMSVAQRLRSGGGAVPSTPAAQTALLGVQLSNAGTGSGALVAGVQPGSPAEALGLAPGDVIVSVDGQQVRSAADLRSAVRAHHPGDQVTVTWVDATGQSHTGSATLAATG